MEIDHWKSVHWIFILGLDFPQGLKFQSLNPILLIIEVERFFKSNIYANILYNMNIWLGTLTRTTINYILIVLKRLPKFTKIYKFLNCEWLKKNIKKWKMQQNLLIIFLHGFRQWNFVLFVCYTNTEGATFSKVIFNA